MKQLFGILVMFVFTTAAFAQRPALIPFRKGDFWGYTDTNKVLKIPVRYENALPFQNGVAIVQTTKDETLLINSEGKKVRKLKYRTGENHKYGLVIFHDKKTYLTGVMDLEGNTVLKPVYTTIEILKNDTFEVVTVKGQKGKILRNGEVAEAFVDFEANEDDFMPEVIHDFVKPTRIGEFNNGLAVVQSRTLFGFCNTAMKLAIDCKYSRADDFYNGLARVLIVAPGQVTEEPYVDENGVTVVQATMLSVGYIDAKGNEYWEDK